MFLFEDFTYDEEWAKKHYGGSNPSNAWDYLGNILHPSDEFLKELDKKGIARKDYIFSVNTIHIPYLDDRVYSVQMYWEKHELNNDQIEYIIDKLSILGDAIKILSKKHNDGYSILISYDVTKDEYRWNKTHDYEDKKEKDINDAVNELSQHNPSLEKWIFMLDSFYNKKSVRRSFKKIKELDDIIDHIIIGYYINYPEAVNYLLGWMYHPLGQYQYNIYKIAFARYAKTYEPDNEIKDLVNDFKTSFKNNQVVPRRGKAIAKILDSDSDVKSYTIINNDYGGVDIEVITRNNHFAKMRYKIYGGLGKCVKLEMYNKNDVKVKSIYGHDISPYGTIIRDAENKMATHIGWIIDNDIFKINEE